MGVAESSIRVASSAGGQVLCAATRLVAVRRADKPLHPRGRLVTAMLDRFGGEDGTGVDWLDQPGREQVLVRTSRAVGLPSPVPDVFGLALRVPVADGRDGDLLFATTGHGRLTRFVLTATRSAYGRPMTTLLPYRTPVGPLLLSATAADNSTFTLAWATRTAAWHPFADLVLREPVGDGDTHLSFDPVRNPLPGLENYGWVRRLREPSYAAARRSRGEPSVPVSGP